MTNQFLVDSAYMVPNSDGALHSKKVPPNTRSKENSEYIETARVKYNRLHAAYEAFIKNKGIRELLQSDQRMKMVFQWILLGLKNCPK